MAFTYIPGRDKGKEVREWGDSLSKLIDTGSDIYQKYKDKKIMEDLRQKQDEEYNMITAADTDSSAADSSLPPVYSLDVKKPLVTPVSELPQAPVAPQAPSGAMQQSPNAYQGYLDYLKKTTYGRGINPYEQHPAIS